MLSQRRSWIIWVSGCLLDRWRFQPVIRIFIPESRVVTTYWFSWSRLFWPFGRRRNVDWCKLQQVVLIYIAECRFEINVHTSWDPFAIDSVPWSVAGKNSCSSLENLADLSLTFTLDPCNIFCPSTASRSIPSLSRSGGFSIKTSVSFVGSRSRHFLNCSVITSPHLRNRFIII